MSQLDNTLNQNTPTPLIAEIIGVGTELLLGDVVNTNATWISKELATMGVTVYNHTTVGDNPERIKQVIAHALSRANILIFTGGLGPTEDDLTHQTIADYFEAPMVHDPDSEEKIRAFFLTRDIQMAKTNIKQAYKPSGAETIENPIGTAPGIAWDVSTKSGKPAYILTFPGVPKELYRMWGTSKDWLEAKMTETGHRQYLLKPLFMHFFGIGESLLAEKLGDLMAYENPTVAPYVGNAEVKIRIVAKAQTLDEAEALIQPVKTAILERAETYYIGDDGISMEQAVGNLLKQNNLKVSVAESCTGGLVSSRLTDVPGSSAYIHLNLVTYSNAQKTAQLGVPEALLATHGAVSPEVAEAMAKGVKALSGSDIGLAITGIAGPEGGSDEKPVGLVYIGLCGLDGQTSSHRVLANPKYGRSDLKFWFSQYALNILRQYLKTLTPEQSKALA